MECFERGNRNAELKKILKYTVVIFLPILAGFAADVAAGRRVSLEYRVKAAYLYNFLKFVDWPGEGGEGSGPYIIGVVGEDPFGKELVSIGEKTVKGRPLKIKYFKRVQELETCHILFVSVSETERIERILKRLDGMPVLTVGDVAGFAQRGGMISLVKKGKTIRFEINLEAAERSGLKISSKLLRLARIVEKQAPTQSK